MPINAATQARAIELIHSIKHQYPRFPSTFGPCSREYCANSARGSRVCGHCLTVELGKLLENTTIANQFHRAVQHLAKVESEINERAYIIDERNDK